MKTVDKPKNDYLKNLERDSETIIKMAQQKVDEIMGEAKKRADVEIDTRIEWLLTKMKEQYKRDFSVVFGNGTWLLEDLQTEETFGGYGNLKGKEYGAERDLINALDSLAQENGTCCTDYDTLYK